MTGQDWLEKDFYASLGVAKDADAAAIKKAYRKLARQYHPDQNAGDAKSEARFKEIGEAYAVLSDPEQRRQYYAKFQEALAADPAYASSATSTRTMSPSPPSTALTWTRCSATTASAFSGTFRTGRSASKRR